MIMVKVYKPRNLLIHLVFSVQDMCTCAFLHAIDLTTVQILKNANKLTMLGPMLNQKIFILLTQGSNYTENVFFSFFLSMIQKT
jgi:hypothetical protein